MKKFTYDVESVPLTADEMAAFANAVSSLCHLHMQHQVSQALESVTKPCGTVVADGTQRRAREMWKTAIVTMSIVEADPEEPTVE